MECIYNLPDIKNCIDHDCEHCLDLDDIYDLQRELNDLKK